MSIPLNIYYKIGKCLLDDKYYKSFVNFAICSKSILPVFTEEYNLYSIYINCLNMNDFLQTLCQSLINLQYKEVLQKNTITLLKEFEKRLKNEVIDETFIETYYESLSAVKFQLDYTLKEPNIRINNGIIIGFRDRIFGNLLKEIDVINENRKVTNVFNEFIKGITYFNDDIRFSNFQPAYHRNTSCSQKGTRNKRCTTKEYNSIIIERCYIERLIYDYIWYNIMNTHQDLGHLEWLEDTKQAYKSCFPDTTIYVKIDYYNDDYEIPINLEIIKETGTKIRTERYTHMYDMINKRYFNSVYVFREYNNIRESWTNTFQNRGIPVILYGGKKRISKKT
jgi:hypothetical protein